MEYKELQKSHQHRVSYTERQVVTFDFAKVKTLICEWKSKGDKFLQEFVSSLSDESLVSLNTIVNTYTRLVPKVIFNTITSEKRIRSEERAKLQLINEWVSVKRELGLKVDISEDTLLSEAIQYISLLTSIRRIQKVTNVSVQGYLDAIPTRLTDELSVLIVCSDYSRPKDDVNSIMRWHIVRSSKSLFLHDVVSAVVVSVLKKMLDISVLPIPNVTTLYLVYIWGAMIQDLSSYYYGNALSSSRIIALAIALVAMLLQILNRGPILSFVKALYSSPYMVADLCKKIPPDIIMATEQILGINFNKYSSVISLTNLFNGWNHTLSELTGVQDLSMAKSLDMLYTYRVGRTFVDYCESRKGLEISSIASCWDNYGPLPKNREQVEGLLNLFRDDSETYDAKVINIYDRHFAVLTEYSDYEVIMSECVAVYRDMSKLNESYHPCTIEWTDLFEIRHKCDNTLIYFIAGQVKERLPRQKDVQLTTQEKIASDIYNHIYCI